MVKTKSENRGNAVFAAVSNPTRRRILELLKRGEHQAGEFVDAFPSLPQPAVSRHLRILREAGLVDVTRDAQRRVYRLNANRLREVDAWVSSYRDFWSDKLDSLKKHLSEK
jgi:DNA-binding transcriptional ArsR family regulator